MQEEIMPLIPKLLIVSDSMGTLARTTARAAASQFGVLDPQVEILSNVRSFDEIRDFLNRQRVTHRRLYGTGARMVLFYSLVEGEVLHQLKEYLEQWPVILAVDLLSDAVNAIGAAIGEAPNGLPGRWHATDEKYYNRIAALEFTIAHDDGLLPQDLPKADIVVIGVSRTSKTPTSIYLGQEGYRTANVPLVANVPPPQQLFNVDSTRIFGLMTSEEVLVNIRRNRMSALGGISAYANTESVRKELDSARALMDRLGCTVINTVDRAIEETAQTIIRLYRESHPSTRGRF